MNRTGIYARLSKEDISRGKVLKGNNSASIENQIDIMEEYAQEQGFQVVERYIDDGYRGVNIENRPELMRLLADIEAGQIDIVLSKDLSRLGRNYLDMGELLENFFPDEDVRYISIGENFDSTKDDSDYVFYCNLMNDRYSKDTSKKVKLILGNKAKAGQYIGRGIYGYRRSEKDRHRLEIDETTAPVVKRIFDMAASGYGYGKIARTLRAECIPNPASVKGKAPKKEYYSEFTWHHSTIRKILHDQVYLGHMIQLKTKVKSYRDAKIKKNKPDKMAIVENTHEPIVEQRTWDTVHAVLTTKRKVCKDGEPHIFTGLLKCSTCGAPLAKNGSKGPAFACSVYKKQGKDYCSSHRITMDRLSTSVLASVQNIMQYVKIDKQGFINEISDDKVSQTQKTLDALKKNRSKKQRRLSKLPELLQTAFEQKAAEMIADEEYHVIIGRYREEKKRIESEVSELARRISELEQSGKKVIDFVSLVEKYIEVTELNSALVHELIERIVVYPVEKIDGQKHQRIDIFYRFIGIIGG